MEGPDTGQRNSQEILGFLWKLNSTFKEHRASTEVVLFLITLVEKAADWQALATPTQVYRCQNKDPKILQKKLRSKGSRTGRTSNLNAKL